MLKYRLPKTIPDNSNKVSIDWSSKLIGTSAINFKHLSKGQNDLKLNGTSTRSRHSQRQRLVEEPIVHYNNQGGVVKEALALGPHFLEIIMKNILLSFSFKDHKIEASDWLLRAFSHTGWFLKLTLATKRIPPSERLWRTGPEMIFFVLVPFSLRSFCPNW